MLDFAAPANVTVAHSGNLLTIYRGQKDWDASMVIEACSLRRSGGPRQRQAAWTSALISQFKQDISGTIAGDQDAKKNLETLLLNAQRYAFQNPFVSTSLSYSVARGFANAGDTKGYVLTIEGPWNSGLDFEYLRKRYGLYSEVFDYLQEFGLPEMIAAPYRVIKVDEVEPDGGAVQILP